MPDKIIVTIITEFLIFIILFCILSYLLLTSPSYISSSKKRALAIPCIIVLISVPAKLSCNNFILDILFSGIAMASCFHCLDVFFVDPLTKNTEIHMSLHQIISEALKPFINLQRHQLHTLNNKINSRSSFSILPSTIVFLLFQGSIYIFLQYFTVESIFLLPRYQFLLFGLICGFYLQVNMEVGNRLLIFFSTLCLCGGEYDKDEWHLMFNEPWKSTSLTNFWSERWHQVFKEIWVSIAYKPLRSFIRNKFNPLLGQKFKKFGNTLELTIPILGVFTLSGIMHEYIVWTALHPFWIPGEQFLFFMLQAAGVILEKLLNQSQLIPPGRFSNWLGWFWTLGFLCFTIPTGSLIRVMHQD